MLSIPTIIKESPIHGLGCFAARSIARFQTVWILQEPVDRVTHSIPYISWERAHGYLSTVESSRFVLPRDNAAFMNFSEDANLLEGKLVNGEPVLHAARDIAEGEELTVPFSSDADVEWKLYGEPQLLEQL